jgi:hypothetical protein
MLRLLGVAAIVAAFAMMPEKASAFACNNNQYVNVSGHLVHSPTCETGSRLGFAGNSGLG